MRAAIIITWLCFDLGIAMPSESNTDAESELHAKTFQDDPLKHHSRLDDDGDVHLQWVSKKKYVIFEATAASRGYVGIGFSPNGGMKNSDIVLCYFDEDSKPHLLDMYAETESLPSLDTSQDYILLSASKNDTHQSCRFSRNKKNCDNKDRNIEAETNHFIWALGEKIPYEQDGKFYFEYHKERRGQKSLYLESSNEFQPPTSPDVKVWKIESPEVTFENGSDSIYYCNIYQFPVVEEKQHIIGIRVNPDPEHLPYLHHIITYQCYFGDKLDGTAFKNHPGASCYEKDFPRAWYMCGHALLVWALGTEGIMYNEKFGFPIEDGRPTFFMMESHFNNGRKMADVKAKAVMEVYYTSNLRQHDVGVLEIGHTVSPFQIIPPGKKDWISRGYCVPECYENISFPEDGINVVAAMHHTHYLGRKLEASIFRDGKEIDILSKDEQYDFEYQGKVNLAKEKKIYKGDTIVGKCHYDSTARTKTTLGGLSSKEEMCLLFYIYYPRINMHRCLSKPSRETIEDVYNVKIISPVGFEINIPHPSYFSVSDGPEKGMSFSNFLSSARVLKKENVEKLQKRILEGDFEYSCLSQKNGTAVREKGIMPTPKLQLKKKIKEACE